jgi:hypothetical protein
MDGMMDSEGKAIQIRSTDLILDLFSAILSDGKDILLTENPTELESAGFSVGVCGLKSRRLRAHRKTSGLKRSNRSFLRQRTRWT